MMNYFSNRKKLMAYLILLTFVFTCIVPTNLGGGNSIAEANTGIAAQSSEEDSIKFKLFNYGPEINYNHDESGNFTTMRAAAAGGYFGFSGAEDDAKDDDGNNIYAQYSADPAYDEAQFGYNHVTVQRVLSGTGDEKYPVLDFRNASTGTVAANVDLTNDARSLNYLFTAGDHAVTAYKLTNSLVSPNAEGYYEYNSTNNAVDLCTPSAAIAGGGYGESAIAIKTDKELTTSSYNEYASEQVETYKDFLPFTNPNSDQTNYISYGTNDNYPEQINGRNIIDDKTYLYDASQVDYWFGMTMETKFMQPEDGKVTDKQGNLQDMVFEFAGDDDVWVFIDDVLVLDLGGAHGVVKGSINFATGVVEQYDTYNRIKSEVDTDGNGYAQNTKCYTTTIKDCFDLAGKLEGKNLSDYFESFEENGETHYRFNDFSTHTINFFYMERYTGSANCHLKFNLMLADTERTATKVWQDDENRDGKRPEKIMVKLSGDNDYTTTSALTHENNWTVTWKDLPKYHDQESVKTEAARKNNRVNGDEIEYTIEELDAEGQPIPNDGTGKYDNNYTTTYSYSEENHVMTITNTHEPEEISIEGQKHWIDEENKNNTRPEIITVNLTGMVGKDIVSTTSQAITLDDDWKYTFTDLPKYHEGEVGKEINYVITENQVTGYQTMYDSDSYDITNIHNENPVLFTDLPVEKKWDDNNNELGLRPSSIKFMLYRDGVATTEQAYTMTPDADGNWYYLFEDLPRYDDNGKAYVYSAVEEDVEGYLSTVVAKADSITIFNKLYNGEVGTFNVSKTVTGDKKPVDGEFGFELEVSAEMKDWDSLLVYNRNELQKQISNANTELGEKQTAFNKQAELFAGAAKVYTTSSAYLFVMDVTTPQAFQYAMVSKDGNVYSKTTTSAYDFWGKAPDFTDTDEKVGLLGSFFDAIKKLAKTFNDLPNPGKFLAELFAETTLGRNVAVQFDQRDAETLLDSANDLLDAEKDLDAAQAAYDDFEDNIPTTPSAIKLIMTPTGKTAGNEKLFDLRPEVADGQENYFNVTDKVYRIPFILKDGGGYDFSIEATTGAAITYKVTEKDYPKTDYEYTKVNDIMNTLTTGTQTLTRESDYALWSFINVYADDPEIPWTPTTPEKKDPPPPPEKTNPDTTIPDEDVPTGSVEPGEPLDELEDPEIPLGDAPATGDTNNAAPFMALMLLAMAGLVITRRKFN